MRMVFAGDHWKTNHFPRQRLLPIPQSVVTGKADLHLGYPVQLTVRNQLTVDGAARSIVNAGTTKLQTVAPAFHTRPAMNRERYMFRVW
jgi:hypothetical protein